MKLLDFAINGLRLYKNSECAMSLIATDAVRNPSFTHPLDGAARNISVNTVIGIAGINASGKTTALRVLELALAITGGLSLGSITSDIAPLLDTCEEQLSIRAIFEQSGKFYYLHSQLKKTGDARTPLHFIQEALAIHHGKLSKTRLHSALHDMDESWSIVSTRNVSKTGAKGELSVDAKRYLPADRSITGAISENINIIAELLPVAPTLTINPAQAVVGLFDSSIETLHSDKDGIHLKFKAEAKPRDLSPAALVSIVSAGTLRGGALLGRSLETLRDGGYLLVDELENSINKQLIFVIMDLFASPVTNPHGATLVFTTHYPELLDHFTRKDSIWFAVRSLEGFALKNLSKHLDRTELKKSVSFFANHVPGTAPSYTAIRALQDYAERYVNA